MAIFEAIGIAVEARAWSLRYDYPDREIELVTNLYSMAQGRAAFLEMEPFGHETIQGRRHHERLMMSAVSQVGH